MAQPKRIHIRLQRRELLVDGVLAPLGGRAFDVLAVLAEARGERVSKDEIMNRVWPGVLVTDNNLQVQIAVLRRALGPDRNMIETTSGRGYRLVGAFSTDADAAIGAGSAAQPAAAVPPASPSAVTNLPSPVSSLIGRDRTLADISGLVLKRRILTLIGAGGIGKTRLGIEAARQCLPDFPDGVWLVELAPLSHESHVFDAVAAALGLAFGGGIASPELIARALRQRRMLVVLDNCEHLLGAAADIAEAMARADPAMRVLATSREPLRVEGEWLYRVPPLDVPLDDASGDALDHGAVQLFAARAAAVDRQLLTDGRSVALAASICRRLDGMPLAIELAAARVGAMTLEELDGRLSDRFSILTEGRRTALPQHRTLRATLDWSHDMLLDGEKAVLRRLATFVGGFTLEAACAVAEDAGSTSLDVMDAVSSLVGKSLVTSDLRGAASYYRLLETTRAYAAEKLAESDDQQPAARRHATYYRDLFARADADAVGRPVADWLDVYGRELDNLRAALDWSFSSAGDRAIGVGLTLSSLSLWKHLSLMEECRQRVERALSALEAGSRDAARHEMLFMSALGAALLYTKGPGPAMTAAWTNALRIAEREGDVDYQLRALFGLWLGVFHRGELGEAFALASRFEATAAAAPDPADRWVGTRIMGSSLHFMGDQVGARRHIEDMLARYVAPIDRTHSVRFNFDQPTAARGFLARILWLEGFADQAIGTARDILEDAEADGHALSVCHALAYAACPVTLFAGDLGTADTLVKRLLDQASRYGLTLWHAIGRCFEGMLAIQSGDAAAGSRLLAAAIDDLGKERFAAYQPGFLGALAEGLGAIGEVERAHALIDDATDRCERLQAHWCMAELLRTRAALMARTGSPSTADAARGHLETALAWSRRQGALAFELRAATALARLESDHQGPARTQSILAPVYARFTEGFQTADLKAARALLDR